ncbi:hypothetical protein [Salinivibrio kushneri]|uniref:Uncharacterized protein n=1 Tax=Salinivibrio kushneri TaxID=1908198 RepID=A0AA47KIQ3_9GAMM|nr:hypothetical protein [Salinivibrio kushneri]WBA07715.1 hypothetical protein N8M53_07525 [Salinivibrio kushneri]
MLKTIVIILLVLLGITAAQYLDEGTQKKIAWVIGAIAGVLALAVIGVELFR